MYSAVGRPSIPPERLLKASLLMALYTVRSERLFCEQLDYNLLFRWFLDMNMDEASFDPTVFTKNRERLLKHDVAGEFFEAIVEQARAAGLMSDEHFTVDGTLIEAWASLKSFQAQGREARRPTAAGRPGKPDRGLPRREAQQRDARIEDRSGGAARAQGQRQGSEAGVLAARADGESERAARRLAVAAANGTAERDTALCDARRLPARDRRITLGGDKGYDTRDFVERCRSATSRRTSRRTSALGAALQSTAGPRAIRATPSASASARRVEEIFGWTKTVGNFRKTRYKGIERTQFASYMVGAAYNLLRIAKLLAMTPV